jgi:hypothetical protein
VCGRGNQVKALQAELDEANASNKIKDAQIETAEHRCAAAVGERDSARRQLAEQQVGYHDGLGAPEVGKVVWGRFLPCFS